MSDKNMIWQSKNNSLFCYSGNPVGLHGEGLSCDQFCAIVENQIENYSWTDQDGKYCPFHWINQKLDIND